LDPKERQIFAHFHVESFKIKNFHADGVLREVDLKAFARKNSRFRCKQLPVFRHVLK
jgi:hypothetical protein